MLQKSQAAKQTVAMLNQQLAVVQFGVRLSQNSAICIAVKKRKNATRMRGCYVKGQGDSRPMRFRNMSACCVKGSTGKLVHHVLQPGVDSHSAL